MSYFLLDRSVGCILYELCALEHAFSGQGLMGVMYRIVEGEPPELPKKYSRELAAVFKRFGFKLLFINLLSAGMLHEGG